MQNILNFLQTICAAEDIGLYSFPFEHYTGLAVKNSQARAIGYKDTLSGWPQISTIAHELGHHALGHLDDDVMMLSDKGDIDPARERREREAQIFAAAFTAFAMYDHYKELGGVAT